MRRQTPRNQEICDSLDLIASESRRCGDLVKNLLTFSRTTPMNLQPADLNQVIDRSLRLVQHNSIWPEFKSSHNSIPACPWSLCDAAQIEQVLLALVMNAIDAMPQGGNLWIVTSVSHESDRAKCASWSATTEPAFPPTSCLASSSLS